MLRTSMKFFRRSFTFLSFLLFFFSSFETTESPQKESYSFFFFIASFVVFSGAFEPQRRTSCTEGDKGTKNGSLFLRGTLRVLVPVRLSGRRALSANVEGTLPGRWFSRPRSDRTRRATNLADRRCYDRLPSFLYFAAISPVARYRSIIDPTFSA